MVLLLEMQAVSIFEGFEECSLPPQDCSTLRPLFPSLLVELVKTISVNKLFGVSRMMELQEDLEIQTMMMLGYLGHNLLLLLDFSILLAPRTSLLVLMVLGVLREQAVLIPEENSLLYLLP